MNPTTADAAAAIRLSLAALREHALGDSADHQDQADVLTALYDDRDRASSVLGMVSDLLTALGERADEQGAEDAGSHLHEAAGCVQDSAGTQIQRALDALGEVPGR
ncbi:MULTISPECIES: hypothetical protein [unclassified Streptomyces]|uniref:hypothetical protein n=1 Tax=unclassified Streptomyces TaxID=2593676 RepID=UPI0033A5FEED